MESHPIHSGSLLRSLLLGRLRWRLLILCISFSAACLGIMAPYAQKKFVDHLLSGYPSQLWIWVAFALTLCAQGFSLIATWLAGREALISQKAMGDRAYGRVIEGTGGLVGRGPAGEAVSLFAVDIPGAAAMLDQALVMASSMLFPLLLTPIALHVFFGIPFWASGICLSTIVLINFCLAYRQSRFFTAFKQLAAERTGLVSEWVQNMRTLRILGWTEAAERRILRLRKRETRNRKKMVTNGQFMNAMASSATYVLNIFAIVFLLNLRGEGASTTPGELLSLLWIMGVFLARPLRQLPWTMVIGMDSITSIRRLQAALDIPLATPSLEGKSLVPAKEGSALSIRGLHLEINEQTLLDDISFDLVPGELVAVVGEVGSGKSLLLQSVVGATSATFSGFYLNGNAIDGPLDLKMRDQVAFVAQEGFTVSASLRENVLFTYLEGGEESLDSAVMHSLNKAQFALTEERINHGLDTEVGERGVNLSGGQRQRISLARSHFSQSPIILMDDPLSAVDIETEKRLIEELICGEWRDRARLIVTHRMAVLPSCDLILFLEGGRLTLKGTYNNLIASSKKFQDFVRREKTKGIEVKAAEVEANG